MPKLIKSWEDLVGLESENYKLEIDLEMCNGHIVPKVETEETLGDNYFDHHRYLSTHTFYGKTYQYSTNLLQKFGFDVEIDNWDKEVEDNNND